MLLRLSFFLFLLPFLLEAQNRSTTYGIHFLSNYSTFSKSDNTLIGDMYKYKYGYGIGGNVNFYLGKGFYFRPELNFERKGTGYEF